MLVGMLLSSWRVILYPLILLIGISILFGYTRELPGKKWPLVIAALLVLSLLFSLYLDTLVALLGVFGWGTFAAAIFPSVVLGLGWSGATKHGAIWSIITSIVLNFALEIGVSNDIVVLPEGIVNGAFTLAIAIIVFIGVSLATETEETTPEVKRVFEG
jgi:Na+/proline symporter